MRQSTAARGAAGWRLRAHLLGGAVLGEAHGEGRERRQPHRALELLTEMGRRGVAPNVITYSAAVSACEKGSLWRQALQLLDEMIERVTE